MTREYTDAGLPFPTGSSFVIDGDNDIEALARALDGRIVTRLPDNSATPAMGVADYPEGVTIAATGAAGWPSTGSATSGLLLTVRTGGRAMQLYSVNNAAAPRQYYRYGTTTAWSAWLGGSSSYAEAAGAVQLSGAANVIRSQTVTLPARFTLPPLITLGSRTGAATPLTVATQVWSPTHTASSFVISASRSNDTRVDIDWHAVQMTGTSAEAFAARSAITTTALVTCPTGGCSNAGVPIEAITAWTDDEGITHPVDAVICGVCGTQLEPHPEEA